MRKYELIFAFILAMILMFLASCRSREVAVSEQVDSVCVSNTLIADMRRQVVDFCFDSMCVEVVDTCREVEEEGRSFRVKVMGGRVRAESLEHRAERSEKRDSIKVRSEYHEERIGKTSGRGCWGWILVSLILVVLIVVLLVILNVRRHIG